MGKGKPRHNPDKPANKYGKRCPYWEEYINGTAGCEGSPLTAAAASGEEDITEGGENQGVNQGGGTTGGELEG